ncbi:MULTISPECIES: hypothetical protein [unclassified Streptomyces]|uniref:hypothetical protein n=1 Tax=unclassified Streptomyces TaxID=2593676 RepID=UPI0004BE2276|nr:MULTISPECIES: hypothetical protein [unclassified Streptomyces]
MVPIEAPRLVTVFWMPPTSALFSSGPAVPRSCRTSSAPRALEEAGTDPVVAQAALDANEEARMEGLRAALALLALAALLALFFTPRIPAAQPSAAGGPADAPS